MQVSFLSFPFGPDAFFPKNVVPSEISLKMMFNALIQFVSIDNTDPLATAYTVAGIGKRCDRVISPASLNPLLFLARSPRLMPSSAWNCTMK